MKWPKLSDNKINKTLEEIINNKSLANSYIFHGSNGLGKFSTAKYFARNIFVSDNLKLKDKTNLLESSSDFFLIEKDESKKNISIEQIRNLNSKINSSSFLNSYKIVIIKDAHYLNQSSANALLKSLEDFKRKTVFILTVDNLELIPGTIISRSQLINFKTLSFNYLYERIKDSYDLGPNNIKNIAKISLGRPGLAFRFIEDSNFYNNYLSLVELIIKFIKLNFHERLTILDDISNLDYLQGGDFSVIEVYQSVLRDLYFFNLGRLDLIRNQFSIESLRDINKNQKEIVSNNLILKKSLSLLESNFKIKSVLEYIAINV